MIDGAQEDAWRHTAYLACVTANAFRDSKSKAATFDDLYPYSAKNKRKRSGADTIHDMAELKAMFKRSGGRGAEH